MANSLHFRLCSTGLSVPSSSHSWFTADSFSSFRLDQVSPHQKDFPQPPYPTAVRLHIQSHCHSTVYHLVSSLHIWIILGNHKLFSLLWLIPVYAFYVQALFNSVHPHNLEGIIFIYKWRNWDIKGHTGSVQQNWGSNLSILAPEPIHLATMLYSLFNSLFFLT